MKPKLHTDLRESIEKILRETVRLILTEGKDAPLTRKSIYSAQSDQLLTLIKMERRECLDQVESVLFTPNGFFREDDNLAYDIMCKIDDLNKLTTNNR